jgi:hypothetical protein
MKSWIVASIAFYFAGWGWNVWLYPHGGLFGDVIYWGHYIWSIGDLCRILSFALLLAIPFRRLA